MAQVTIIGLGRLGTSLGLALKQRAAGWLDVVGHDRNLEAARGAQARRAVDRAEWNLPAACEKADAVLLCVPLSDTRQALAEVGPHLKEGCVVTDTAPLKTPVLEWAAELIPAGRHFVGGNPILNPAYLHDSLTEPRADLFERGLWALVPSADPPPEALKLVGDLALVVGAKPFFVGAAEHDALLAWTHTLPALLAAGLVRAASDSPGWADARKLADRNFAAATAPLSLASPPAYGAAAALNQADVLQALDRLIDQLREMRRAVADAEGQRLEELLGQAAQAREEWLEQRREAKWETEGISRVDLPTSRQLFGRMIGLGRGGEKKKK